MENDGGLKDEGGSIDPVSGNDVPIGSTKEEVRDDIPAQLSEGEFVFPADVVRYIGLEKLMMMRQEAKQGLKKMEAMGQMGNADEATVPDDLPFDETDIIAEDDDGNVVEMQKGGLTPSSMYNQYMGASGIKQVVYVNPETGDEILVYIVSGTPVPAVPKGYVPKGSTSPDAIKESKITNPIVQPETVQEDKDETYTVYNGKIINPGKPISLDAESGADTWANLGAETMFGRAVDQSKAPAGWNTQNQREYDAMKKAGLDDIQAMWNGKDWDVYSPSLDNTAYGTPGRRGLKSKYGSLFKNVKTGFGMENTGFGPTGVIKNIAQASNQSYIDGLEAAMTSIGRGVTQKKSKASEEALAGTSKRFGDQFKPKMKKGKKQKTIRGVKVGSKDFAQNMQKKVEEDKAARTGTIFKGNTQKVDKYKGPLADKPKEDKGLTDEQKNFGI